MKKIILTIFLIAAVFSAGAQSVVDVFRIADYPDNFELNPMLVDTAREAQFFTAVYEGLFTFAPDYTTLLPGAATEYELSEDKLTYTFTLRENAFWSNGDALTAHDFVRAWNYMIQPANDTPYSSLFDIIANVKDIKEGKRTAPGFLAVDDYTLQVTLESPAPHFLNMIVHHSFYPAHQELINGSITPPSNGPYYITAQSDEKITMNKNYLYWAQEAVQIPVIEYILSENTLQITEDFNAGTIHWLRTNPFYDTLHNRNAIIVNPGFSTTMYYFNAGAEPWNNADVRLAMWQLLPDQVLRNPEESYFPSDSIIPAIPGYPEIDSKVNENIESALALLEKAGFPGGMNLPELRLMIQDNAHSFEQAEIMKNAWESQLDINVEIIRIPFQNYFAMQNDSQFDIAMVSWIGDYPDPLTFLQLFQKNTRMIMANSDLPEYERMISEAGSLEGDERLQALAEAEEYLINQGMVYPIEHGIDVNIIDLEAIGGWYPNPFDIHSYKFLYFLKATIDPGFI